MAKTAIYADRFHMDGRFLWKQKGVSCRSAVSGIAMHFFYVPCVFFSYMLAISLHMWYMISAS